MEQENDFRKWYIEKSAIAGALITQKIAALISGISESQISRKVKNGKLTVYEHPQLPKGLLSYSQVLQLERERAAKKNVLTKELKVNTEL